MKRSDIYRDYKKYEKHKDNRTMEELCINPENEFNLQVQQNFLKEYVQNNPDWKKLLLYHEIGSGKTCTAITIAEDFLSINPLNKITIILPARLKTNMIDELISPCSMNKYISNEEYILYNKCDTPLKIKNNIKKKFINVIYEKYNILSFEKFRINMLLHKSNIINYIKSFSKNNLIIIDEVHNLFSTNYDNKNYIEIETIGEIKKNFKGLNTILLKLISKYADDSCKMLLLTATPIFNDIDQLKELTLIMTPEAKIEKNYKLSNLIEYLRGKISYFPGISLNAYPTSIYNYHNIIISKTQDEKINEIIEKNEDPENPDKESFLSNQRQCSLSCLPDNLKVKTNMNMVLSNMPEYSPKIYDLINNIKNNIGKQIIYTSFIDTGINVIVEVLKKNGWISLKEVINDIKLWNKYKNKIYAIWSGSIKDNEKQLIKSIINNTNNLFGEKLKIIIGSPSIREGISFKHIQNIHILDPVWNISAKKQIEGRAIRFCSHIDIDEVRDFPLKRNVIIDIYQLIPRLKGELIETPDQKIYNIIEKKKESVIKGENALKKVSIDYHLFKKIYSTLPTSSPLSSKSNSQKSNISIENNMTMKNRQKKIIEKTNCPKPRRPIKGLCSDGYNKKINNNGYECCYKNKKIKIEKEKEKENKDKKCQKNKTPIDGKCQDGYHIKLNKHNINCCYKNMRKK